MQGLASAGNQLQPAQVCPSFKQPLGQGRGRRRIEAMHIYDQHTPVSPDLFLYGPSRLGAALRGSVLNRGENGSDPSQLLLPDGRDIPA